MRNIKQLEAVFFLGSILTFFQMAGLGLVYSGIPSNSSEKEDGFNDIFNPNSSSEKILIDKVYLFTPPQTIHNFSFNFEDEIHYYLFFKVYTPNTEILLTCTLIGPDGDCNDLDDKFIIGNGILLENSSTEAESWFGCALTGLYNLTIEGNCSENVNLHIFIESRGRLEDDQGTIEYHVDGFNGEYIKQRHYTPTLEDDKEYRVKIARVNSIAGSGSFLRITVDIFDNISSNEHIFHIIRSVSLIQVNTFITESFGSSYSGNYRMEVEIETNIPTVNLLIILSEIDNIGNGSESIDPTQTNFTNNNNFTSNFQINVPEWLFPVLLTGGIGMVITVLFLNGGKKIKKPNER